jgi:hypothetical protein
MVEDLNRTWRRWREAEDAGQTDEADAEFGRLFRASVPAEPLSSSFTAGTMEKVARAAERDALRARRMRRILAPVAVIGGGVAVYAGSGLILSAFSAVIIRVLDLLVTAVVGVATSNPADSDLWTVMASLGRATAALLTNPAITTTILALQGVAVAALFALQRLLRSEGDTFR